MMIRAVGLGLAIVPITTGGISSLPASIVSAGSAFNTLTQRVTSALGLAVLTALATSQQAQAMADRSGLLTAEGPSEDPRIKALQQQGPGGAIPLWQHTQLQAQAQAHSNVFLVAGLCTLAGVIGAFFLPSGRPPASEGAMPIEI